MSIKQAVKRRLQRALGVSPDQIRKIVRAERKAAANSTGWSFHTKMTRDVLPYSNYAYGLYYATKQASKLGIERISAIEFGVAGGNGLLAMEAHANEIEKINGVGIDIYGFDTGGGLTASVDYRDMPYRFTQGNYAMDIDRLKARLKTSALVIGDVAETTKTFINTYNPAPIGFVSFDLDYYSSTMSAFSMFQDDADNTHFLPRPFCYFDDTIGDLIAAYSDFSGELAAIKDFNDQNKFVKFSELREPRKYTFGVMWYHKFYVMHRFRHPAYNQYIANTDSSSLSLKE